MLENRGRTCWSIKDCESVSAEVQVVYCLRDGDSFTNTSHVSIEKGENFGLRGEKVPQSRDGAAAQGS